MPGLYRRGTIGYGTDFFDFGRDTSLDPKISPCRMRYFMAHSENFHQHPLMEVVNKTNLQTRYIEEAGVDYTRAISIL